METTTEEAERAEKKNKAVINVCATHATAAAMLAA
jgi:hypothetical protein